MLNELIKMCEANISEYVKSEGSAEFYYMGKVHVLLNVIYMHVVETGYKGAKQYEAINRKWEEVFRKRVFK